MMPFLDANEPLKVGMPEICNSHFALFKRNLIYSISSAFQTKKSRHVEPNFRNCENYLPDTVIRRVSRLLIPDDDGACGLQKSMFIPLSVN